MRRRPSGMFMFQKRLREWEAGRQACGDVLAWNVRVARQSKGGAKVACRWEEPLVTSSLQAGHAMPGEVLPFPPASALTQTHEWGHLWAVRGFGR